jgi:hypothetical protein
LLMSRRLLVRALATAILAGESTVEQIVIRGERVLGGEWQWLRPVAERYLAAFGGRTRPRLREVIGFVSQDPGFQDAWSKHVEELSVKHWLTEPQQMQPVPAAARWNVPPIPAAGDLASWLRLDVGELEWFADVRGLCNKRTSPQLQHYHYAAAIKRSGNVRLLEAPKARLKSVQRQILAGILESVPAHAAVHGFIKQRSIKTFVAPHIGKRVVLRMDLQDFFPSFRAARIQSFFRTIGYPEAVADLLAGICTNSVPRYIWKGLSVDINRAQLREASTFYARQHLPQGAPTSPALANLCAYRMDCRLAGLARSAGAEYTRYADDLAFSGDDGFEEGVERFSTHVAAILIEEGFTVQYHKTRVMRRAVRQHLAGLIANVHPNVRRSEFDRLKAILTNCAKFGPASQNRDNHPLFRSHLEGRVGFVEQVNPAKGQRLRKILDEIDW